MLPLSGFGKGISFPVGPIPVRIDLSFIVVAALLVLSAGLTLEQGLVAFAVVFLSVLLHEFGHAIAARMHGAKPSVVIAGLGGYTSFSPPRRLSRLGSAVITASGPLVNVLIALGGVVVRSGLGYDTTVVRAVIWINIALAVLNLLPIVPLDGGAIMQQAIPGKSALIRHRRAASVSIVIGVVAAIFAFQQGIVFGALLLGYFAFVNWKSLPEIQAAGTLEVQRNHIVGLLNRSAAGDRTAERELEQLVAALQPSTFRDVVKARMVEMALWDADHLRARRLIEQLPGDSSPALYAYLEVFNGNTDLAQTMLAERLATDPDEHVGRYVLLAAVDAGAGREVPARFAQFPDAARDVDVLRAAHHRAHLLGHYADGVAIGEALLEAYPDDALPIDRYNLACSLTRSDRNAEAMDMLAAAVDEGWDDPSRLDHDPDLAVLRIDPRWNTIRSKVS